jgi:hypothetical protein
VAPERRLQTRERASSTCWRKRRRRRRRRQMMSYEEFSWEEWKQCNGSLRIALSPSRFIAVDPSFLQVLRSGKNKARRSWDLRGLQRRGGQGANLSGWLGMAWSSTGPWCPRHDKSKGLQPKPCQCQPAGMSVHTPTGLAELTSTWPATHGGGWMDDGLWIENSFSLVFQSHS